MSHPIHTGRRRWLLFTAAAAASGLVGCGGGLDDDVRLRAVNATIDVSGIDVDYNGWWMCLIPVETLRTVGLSLPLFIKWDDSEFGLRAKQAGYPTVSFPGAAVWHVPWTDKNDGVDWQSYFHHRNRIIAALLHSPYERGGRMVRESLNHQIKHLVSLQYSTAEIRHQALLDLVGHEVR